MWNRARSLMLLPASSTAAVYRDSARGLQSRRIIHVWDRVLPSFWHPMASLEQSLMDVEVMARRVFCPRFPPYAPLSPSIMPKLHHDDDSFFKDLPIQRSEKTSKQTASATAPQAPDMGNDEFKSEGSQSPTSPQARAFGRETQSAEKEGTEAALEAEESSAGQAGTAARPTYSSYSYSYSTVLDKEGHHVGTSRRRYEDSTGYLKAQHEREIDGKKLKTVWKRSGEDDEGDCETICTTGSSEEFEREWINTPFGRAEVEEQAKWMEERERRVHEAFGMEYKPVETSKATTEKMLVEEVKERKEAIEQASKTQEEETTPPQFTS
ncbi:hypothetical protein PHYBOEH_012020 [Phytophthora boehmeriae]|uniref:Uncharacterized protein n=1 Tax=Phytophthora boehmeriae TaxID=109152 RepID=A0A8T1WXI1_9STRA|nr:hypothetical protein PHYBOEH_012020 [Phytophthora boehmeriae]